MIESITNQLTTAEAVGEECIRLINDSHLHSAVIINLLISLLFASINPQHNIKTRFFMEIEEVLQKYSGCSCADCKSKRDAL